MRKRQQRAIALQAVRELLPLMGLRSEQVEAPDAFCVFDELGETQPQSVAYQWWVSATDRDIDLFVDEWEEWRVQERRRCAFCEGHLEPKDNVSCAACSDVLSGPEDVCSLPF